MWGDGVGDKTSTLNSYGIKNVGKELKHNWIRWLKNENTQKLLVINYERKAYENMWNVFKNMKCD